MKRRKIVLPLDDLLAKKNKSKIPNAKVVSRILVDFVKTKYLEIVEPLVDNSAEEVNCSD